MSASTQMVRHEFGASLTLTVAPQVGVGILTLNRPPMNVLNIDLQQQLGQAAAFIADHNEIRAVVLHGAGRAFAAGADVKEFVHWSLADAEAGVRVLHENFNAIAAIPQPTIAAVHGFALGGGCELAMCCDLRLADAHTRLGQPEILLGVIPGAGGTQRLTRLVGPARANDLIFTGRMIDAATALDWGLVNQVTQPDAAAVAAAGEDKAALGQAQAAAVLAAATALAEQLARGPAEALRAAKRTIAAADQAQLAGGLTQEMTEFAALFGTADRTLGMESFIEHGPGKAHFTGAPKQ